jgi:tetratricopeptide (TPR) repeat protein
MPIRLSRLAIAFLMIGFSAGPSPLYAQDSPAPPSAEDAYQSQRKFANTLLDQNKYLEALPVFESLAKQNPNDADVIFGWGLSLMNHSATLTDTEAARQERVRARELLIRSKELGKKSGLLDNLLDMLPPDGAVTFSSAGDVDAAMKAGEAAFAKNDYEEAIKNYTHAAQLDPKNYHALLFIGDSYFAQKKFPEAVQWYDRAIALDPDIETGYRYEADLYIKSGEMEKARRRSIQAVVANPYTQATWRAMNYWANSNKVELKKLHINTPAAETKNGQTNITLNMNSKDGILGGMAWIIYGGVRTQWQKEEFKKHFPDAKEYRHSLAEESAALNTAAVGVSNDAKKNKKLPTDPDIALLMALYDAKMIEPYVLLSAPDRDIALNDYAPYRSQHRDQLEAYLSQFVVPPTPPQTGKN